MFSCDGLIIKIKKMEYDLKEAKKVYEDLVMETPIGVARYVTALENEIEEQLNIHSVTKRNWFEKLPLHWKLALHLIGGIIIGLLLPYVW